MSSSDLTAPPSPSPLPASPSPSLCLSTVTSRSSVRSPSPSTASSCPSLASSSSVVVSSSSSSSSPSSSSSSSVELTKLDKCYIFDLLNESARKSHGDEKDAELYAEVACEATGHLQKVITVADVRKMVNSGRVRTNRVAEVDKAEELVWMKKLEQLETDKRRTMTRQKQKVVEEREQTLCAPPKRVHSDLTQKQMDAVQALKEFKVKQDHVRAERRSVKTKTRSTKDVAEESREEDKENVVPSTPVASSSSSCSSSDRALVEPLTRKELMFKSAKGRFDVAESNAKINDGILRLVVALEANLQRQTEAIESIAANSTRQTQAIESFLSR